MGIALSNEEGSKVSPWLTFTDSCRKEWHIVNEFYNFIASEYK